VNVCKKFLNLILITILCCPIIVYAARGCCSWHGGISHCGDNGYYICNDGTQSPSCTCYSSGSNNDIVLTDTSCEDDYNDIADKNEEIRKLENKVENLEEKIEESDNKISNYQFLLFVALCCIIYFWIKKGR